MKRAPILIAFIACWILCSCGGGGSSSTNPITQPPPPVVTPPPPVISITSPSTLPGAIAGVPYSYTFTESGGTAPFTWQIIWGLPAMRLSSDGVLSGTSPQYLGGSPNQSFTVQVTDSATPPNTATKMVSLDIFGLEAGLRLPQVSVLYDQNFLTTLGGTEPITWSLSGALPPGLNFVKNPASSDTREYLIQGTPTQSGSYNFSVTVSDSGTPQRSETVAFAMQVEPSPLTLSNSQPPIAVVGQPYSYSFTPRGGTPPFSWFMNITSPDSSLPGSLVFDPSGGTISGTPTAGGNVAIQIQIRDTSVPHQQGFTNNYNVLVEPAPLPNRNDSIANATPLYPGSYVAAISPFGDPPGAVAPDQDYYQYTAQGGSTVFLSVSNQVFPYGQLYSTSPFDPVIELLDGSGQQLTTCNDPLNDNPASGSVIPQDATPTGFDDACTDWDGDFNPYPGGKTSSLTLKVPGDPSTQTTFYIHIFDWRGDARPDMTYTFTIRPQ